jgi:hypothetical protein
MYYFSMGKWGKVIYYCSQTELTTGWFFGRPEIHNNIPGKFREMWFSSVFPMTIPAKFRGMWIFSEEKKLLDELNRGLNNEAWRKCFEMDTYAVRWKMVILAA